MNKLKELIASGDYISAAEHFIENRFNQEFPKKDIDINALASEFTNQRNNPNPHDLLILATLHYEAGNYEKACENFEKAENATLFGAVQYLEYGESLFNTDKVAEAITRFQKAVEIAPTFSLPHKALAQAYEKIGDIEKATEEYRTSITDKDASNWSFWNAAKFFEKYGRLEEALLAYNKAVELSADSPEFVKKFIAEAFESLQEKTRSPDAITLANTVNEVLDLLKYDGEMVVHYTGISTLHALVFENSKFRLSEASFLNDPTEGSIFLNQFLRMNINKAATEGASEEKEFVTKPYIGSFVPQKKSNNLSLWRMYGKENGIDAAGCSITLDRAGFMEITTERVKNSPASKFDSERKHAMKKSIDFYNVAYLMNDGSFKLPNSPENESALMEKCSILKDLANKHSIPEALIEEELSKVAYLFKGAEYIEENEIRIIIFDKSILPTLEEPPQKTKVYWELESINKLIRKICFGPKITSPDETMALYYHKMRAIGNLVKIASSQLAFK